MAETLTSHQIQFGNSQSINQSRPRGRDWPERLVDRVGESFANVWPQPYALIDPDIAAGSLGWGGVGFGRGVTGTIADRKGGKDLPLFWSEIDLRGFRVLSRWLWDTNPFMIGFGRRLTDYHIRTGYQWQSCAKGQKKQAYATGAGEDGGDKTVEKGQNILDEWRDRNGWPLKSREGFMRLRRDGEVFMRFGWERRGELPWMRWIEPEQVGSPTGDTNSDNSFGIRNVPGDVETYTDFFVRDPVGSGTEGQWVSAQKIVYAKTNTDSTVKRGLPDSFSVHEYLDESRKLVRNMLIVASAQAAIAWREKFPTASEEQVRALIPTYSVNTQVPPWQNGGQTIYSEKMAAGTVLRTEGSREFEPGPVSTGVASYVEVEQAALRACCVRWGFPPYMTAKADDINFASSLTSGSPFAVAVEGGQVEWAAVERAVAMKVLDLACEAGLLTPDERAKLDVEVTEPAVITPDPASDTGRRKILYDAKIIDPYTWMQEEGYDPSHIEANWKAWTARNGQPAGQQQQPGNLDRAGEIPPGMLESVLKESFTGTITDSLGREIHYADGKRVAGSGSEPNIAQSLRDTADSINATLATAKTDREKWAAYRSARPAIREKINTAVESRVEAAVPKIADLTGKSEEIVRRKLRRVPGAIAASLSLDADVKDAITRGIPVENPSLVGPMQSLHGALDDAGMIGHDVSAEMEQALFGLRLTNEEREAFVNYDDRDAFSKVVNKLSGITFESILWEGFSGTVTDSRGREYHYVNGKRVAAAKKDAATAAHAEVESAVAKAFNDPNTLNPGYVKELSGHLKTLTKDRLQDLAGQIKLRIGGQKADLAERLLAHVHDHRANEAAKPKPGDVRTVPTKSLRVDPARFQFKLNTNNASGVTDELKSVRTWNPEFAGVIAVWEDPDNAETYVVNGHHRHELGDRLGVPDMAVRYIDAPDARTARAKGALINIAEGRGTAIDAAKFMRDMNVTAKDFIEHGIALKPGALADQAQTLTKLNDGAFDRLARGDLDQSQALAVATHLSDPHKQEKLFKIIRQKEDDGRDLSNRTIEELARALELAPTITTTDDNTLFGSLEMTDDVSIQRAELAGYVRSELSKEMTDYTVLASQRRADKTSSAGNILNVDRNKELADTADRSKNVYDMLVNRKGPISDALNAAAVILAKAKTKKERDHARHEAATAVQQAIRRELATFHTG